MVGLYSSLLFRLQTIDRAFHSPSRGGIISLPPVIVNLLAKSTGVGTGGGGRGACAPTLFRVGGGKDMCVPPPHFQTQNLGLGIEPTDICDMTSLWRGLHHGVGPVRCAPPPTFCHVPTPLKSIDKRIFLSEEHCNSGPSYPTISDTNRGTWVESGNDSTLHRWKDELLWVIEIKKIFLLDQC